MERPDVPSHRFLARNSRHAGLYFNILPARVVEIGAQVDL